MKFLLKGYGAIINENRKMLFTLQRGKVWSHKTSIIPPHLYIEVIVPSQESELSCICVLEISTLPLSTMFLLDFRTVPIVWYISLFVVFHFLG